MLETWVEFCVRVGVRIYKTLIIMCAFFFLINAFCKKEKKNFFKFNFKGKIFWKLSVKFPFFHGMNTF